MGNPVTMFKQHIPGTKEFTLNPMDRINESLGMGETDENGNSTQTTLQTPQLSSYQRMAAAAPNPQVEAALAAAQALRNPPATTQPVPTGPQGQQYGARVAAPRFASALTPTTEV